MPRGASKKQKKIAAAAFKAASQPAKPMAQEAVATDTQDNAAEPKGKKGKLIRPRGKRGGIKHKKPTTKDADAVQAAAKKAAATKLNGAGKEKAAATKSAADSEEAVPAEGTEAPDHATKIAKFHTLLKQLEQATSAEEREEIQKGLDTLGGLAQYQAWSLTGSAKGGHTPTSKWCVEALNSVYEHDRSKPKFKVLDVGAITGTAYDKYRWIEPTYIDLHPQGDKVQQYSFFDFPQPETPESRFDMVALSLVINFVGDVRKRSEMLLHSHKYLVEEGFLFLVLPLPCLTNSRYMNQTHLRSLIDSIGFNVLKQSDSAKLSRWLLQRKPAPENQWNGTVFKKREINPGPERNNFAIVLDPKPSA
ncbi:hypothetical protein BCV70DRAFT_197437 [Testicularia cyperi]|uniref:25S rRNA adenine-N(1) methyltransferase n=1 Tax=Testicularia cyperi TaxID=1882483 RepID=A0A317XY27_9BASI|nr:hypothetical protein BCV70DRAFT_197437 [Testicularia cyperi]